MAIFIQAFINTELIKDFFYCFAADILALCNKFNANPTMRNTGFIIGRNKRLIVHPSSDINNAVLCKHVRL